MEPAGRCWLGEPRLVNLYATKRFKLQIHTTSGKFEVTEMNHYPHLKPLQVNNQALGRKKCGGLAKPMYSVGR